MATEEIQKLLDILSQHPADGTDAAAARELNRKRLAALRELALRCHVENKEVLDRLETLVATDEEISIRVAAVKAAVSIHKRDGNWNGLAEILQNFLANDRQEVWEQAANALADELEPPAGVALKDTARQAALDALGRGWGS